MSYLWVRNLSLYPLGLSPNKFDASLSYSSTPTSIKTLFGCLTFCWMVSFPSEIPMMAKYCCFYANHAHSFIALALGPLSSCSHAYPTTIPIDSCITMNPPLKEWCNIRLAQRPFAVYSFFHPIYWYEFFWSIVPFLPSSIHLSFPIPSPNLTICH